MALLVERDQRAEDARQAEDARRRGVPNDPFFTDPRRVAARGRIIHRLRWGGHE
jgi:hypothetical protein